jgi:hypothetical protein
MKIQVYAYVDIYIYVPKNISVTAELFPYINIYINMYIYNHLYMFIYNNLFIKTDKT